MSVTTTNNVTSVPRPTWDTKLGFQVPTEQAILNGVMSDFQAAFGGGLNTALETPQGQLASTETAIISDTNDNYLFITQQVDPAYSSGRFQDAIGRIYFITRYPARATVVQATCNGLQGVVIPAGVKAQADDGNTYVAIGSGTIDATGNVTIPFECTVTGEIACPTGSLNQRLNVIPGWDSIINNADGVEGQDVESRAQFERRRFDSVAGNSVGMLASVRGAVLSIPDVLDCYVTENYTDTAFIQDGVTMLAHSLYVCVSGGSDADVANAIFTRKSPGCAMSGTYPNPPPNGYIVFDKNAGYTPPYPSYAIYWQRPASQTFTVNVTIVNSNLVPFDALTQIQTAVVNAFEGIDGGIRASIGSTLYASRFYGPVASLGTWVQLVSIKLGSDAAPAAQFMGTVATTSGTTTLTVTAMTAGALAIGQTISGSGLSDGTRITTIVTGSGGVGTYTLNIAPTAAITVAEPMVAVLPSLDDVSIGIAHAPVLSAANVYVTLV